MTEYSEKTNVLLILTDDQGWDDYGCHGNPWLRTPNLDRMREESVRFSNYYVASVCAPSRASLLTGRHFLRVGVAHVHGGKDFIHPGEVLISDLFRQGGYATGMWGKWHSGKSSGYFPWERGFDEAYMAQLYKHKDSIGRMNGREVSHEGWTVDTLTDYAIDFLKRQKEGGKPFFAFLPYLTVHAPLVAPDGLIDEYEAMGMSRALATVYAMIDQLDVNIGRLMDALQELDLEKNTVMLFMSDNGPACLEGTLSDADRRQRYVNRYKGHKGNMWENGIKSPLWVRQPGRFEPHDVERLCDICDILPTLCDLCGIEIPADHPKLDGRSIRAYLEGDESGLEPKESYIYVNPGWPPDPDRPYHINGYFNEYDPVPPDKKQALPFDPQLVSLRTEDYKLLCNPGRVPDMPELVDGRALIHIAEDPKEDRNIAATETARADAMREKLAGWFDEIKKEPHSFHIPVFQIGRDRTNFVAAYAPVTMRGGIHNGGLASLNWKAVGDGADYEVDVTEAGDYRVILEVEKVADKKIVLRVSAGEEKTEAAISGDKMQDMGEIKLEAGKQRLSLDVIDAEESESAILHKIVYLIFERTAQAGQGNVPRSLMF
ncbi:MAG: sulfatase-like hydrolase/transferase [Candidatus Sumerlaeia bacterium]